MPLVELYSYFRSSAAYRVRIALNLKGIDYQQRPVHLIREGGEHRQAAYLRINPQGLVPTLVDGETVVTQSLAIIEYIEEAFQKPALLPQHARDRAYVRSLAQIVACDIHPLNNLRVLRYLRDDLGQKEPDCQTWYQHWVLDGFRAFEARLEQLDKAGDYCFGDSPTIADCCLVPQVYNAQRYACDLSSFPNLMRVTESCLCLDAFQRAVPERQPDANP